MFYRLTPSLNASLTVNTDFSATEIDDRQVNLTRFNLFFPEKRDFFLNDSDLFEFGRIGRNTNVAATSASMQSGRPFFSRRLGLSATGEPVDIEYGGKLSGRVGRFSIGTLAVQSRRVRAESGDAERLDVDAKTLSSARIAADVLGESTLGMIFTDGDPRSNVDNSLVGRRLPVSQHAAAGRPLARGGGLVSRDRYAGYEDEDTCVRRRHQHAERRRLARRVR